ncbi:MAG: hypothetical protein QXL16_02730, partial [Candidatus Micrarchaeaceae archaeon]
AVKTEIERVSRDIVSREDLIVRSMEEEKKIKSIKEKCEEEANKISAKLEKTKEELKKHKENMSKLISSENLDIEELNKKRAEQEKIIKREAELKKEIDLLSKDLQESISARELEIEKKKRKEIEVKETEKELEKAKMEKEELEKSIEESGEEGSKIYTRIQKIEEENSADSKELGSINEKISVLVRRKVELEAKEREVNTRVADLYSEILAYGMDENGIIEGKIEEMEKEILEINASLSSLGGVNMKAPEMFEEKKKEVEEEIAKLQKLQKEKDSILHMIEEVEEKKLKTFNATFEEVNKNFSKLFSYVFPGSASIKLDNLKDPFNSGLTFKIENQEDKEILSFSGGEKSFLILILLFSIHLCKKSSIYIFDEVDAALDKENSKKLSLLIKEMSKDSQFIVVSHNDSLIVNADSAIGVAKEKGYSKAVGLEIGKLLTG